MNRIKTVYVIIGLIAFVALGALAIVPELIPSWVWVQQIVILVLYVANIVFVYVIIVRIWNYLRDYYSRKRAALAASFIAFMLIGSLFVAFIFTSLGIGQGIMGSTLSKELKYPDQKTKLFLYNSGFLDAGTTLKMKHRIWPVMEDLAIIDSCHHKDLDIVKFGDTLKISCQNVMVKVNLAKRTAEKVFLTADGVKKK